MIDKKPFRVTNEEAKSKYSYYSKAIYPSNETILIIDLSADLLDSRELIDKQEALIKEMRIFIESIVLDGCSAEIKRDVILEKTKEYA